MWVVPGQPPPPPGMVPAMPMHFVTGAMPGHMVLPPGVMQVMPGMPMHTAPTAGMLPMAIMSMGATTPAQSASASSTAPAPAAPPAHSPAGADAARELQLALSRGGGCAAAAGSGPAPSPPAAVHAVMAGASHQYVMMHTMVHPGMVHGMTGPPMHGMPHMPMMPPGLPPGMPPMPQLPPGAMMDHATMAALGAAAGTAAAAAAAGQPVADVDEGRMALMRANASAQEMQYMQQFQFYQQLQVQEAQRRKKEDKSMPSRFKEGFRPMRLCKHLLTMGFCKQSHECTFGHVYEELHPASPDLPRDYVNPSSSTNSLCEQGEIPESQVPDMRLKKKKEMCGRHSRGECSLGKICPFAHSEAELGTIGLSVCGKVKTRLCVFWDPKTQNAKGCIYGRSCNNAHGEREIGTKRPPPELAPPTKRPRRDGESVIAGKD